MQDDLLPCHAPLPREQAQQIGKVCSNTFGCPWIPVFLVCMAAVLIGWFFVASLCLELGISTRQGRRDLAGHIKFHEST